MSLTLYQPISMLHADGAIIRDALGNVVIPRGPNAGNFGDVASGWGNTTWNETTVRNNFAAMKRWGLNAVRIMGTCRWWLENAREVYYSTGDPCNKGQRDAMIDTVQLAKEYGIYVIVSLWSIDTNYSFGARNPTIQDYLPYPPNASTQNFATIRNSADFAALWTGSSSNHPFLARFDDVDQSTDPTLGVPITSTHVHNNNTPPPSIAEAFQNYPNVIYEMYNEPSGNDSNWSQTTASIIDGIRARGDEHLIMVMCGYAGSFYAWFNTMNAQVVGKKDLVFSNHAYRQYGSYPGNPYTYSDMRTTLITSSANPPGYGLGHVLSRKYPVIIGEIGSGTDSQELECLRSCLRIYRENNVGWMGWEWRTGVGFALIDGSFNPTTRGWPMRTEALKFRGLWDHHWGRHY